MPIFKPPVGRERRYRVTKNTSYASVNDRIAKHVVDTSVRITGIEPRQHFVLLSSFSTTRLQGGWSHHQLDAHTMPPRAALFNRLESSLLRIQDAEFLKVVDMCSEDDDCAFLVRKKTIVSFFRAGTATKGDPGTDKSVYPI
jgi:hypothetical protein